MKRRQFITCFGATLAANTLMCSLAARAQQSAMPSGALPSSAKPDNPANGLDPLLQQAQALGAPMAAVARAITRQQTFAKKDALAVFDISQPSANKRFYLLDFKSGEVTAYYAAHGRSNGPNAKAVKFKGFQRDLDMTPLGPLKTAHSEVMAHYKTIIDRYDGTVYRNMIVAVLQGVTSYNSYINHTPPFKWILASKLVHHRRLPRGKQRHAGPEQRLHHRRSGRKQQTRHATPGWSIDLRNGRR